MARGVPVVPLTLHTGVSSPELHEPPYPERFAVPEVTARLVNSTRRAGGRVVAVGTTVTRALETATDDDGVTRAAAGWTDLVLGPDRPARAVTGLITGLHEPEASHLQLLEAVAGPDLVADGLRPAPSPSTTSGTSSATRCSSCPEDSSRRRQTSGRPLQQRGRSAGGRRGHEVHSDPPGSRPSGSTTPGG